MAFYDFEESWKADKHKDTVWCSWSRMMVICVGFLTTGILKSDEPRGCGQGMSMVYKVVSKWKSVCVCWRVEVSTVAKPKCGTVQEKCKLIKMSYFFWVCTLYHLCVLTLGFFLMLIRKKFWLLVMSRNV